MRRLTPPPPTVFAHHRLCQASHLSYGQRDKCWWFLLCCPQQSPLCARPPTGSGVFVGVKNSATMAITAIVAYGVFGPLLVCILPSTGMHLSFACLVPFRIRC